MQHITNTAIDAFGTLVDMNGLAHTLEAIYAINDDFDLTYDLCIAWVERADLDPETYEECVDTMKSFRANLGK